MKILVVDDEPLAREELKYLLEQNSLVSFVDQAESVDSAKDKLLGNNFDLIFLDIELGNQSGFDLAKTLKQLTNQPRIIFATAYNQYALDAFEVNAIDYILKPFDPKRIDQALEKAKPLIKENTTIIQESNRISVTIDDRTIVLKIADILYVYTEAGKLNITTAEQTYPSRQTLAHFFKSLDPRQFMQVHRSYIVNVSEILSAEPSFNNTYLLTMSNHDKVPVARSYVSQMKAALGM